MRILILEDEPIIAIDIEDIVTATVPEAECCLASSVAAGLGCIEGGIDFAMLDVHPCHHRENCWPIAGHLAARGTPFCFVTSSRREIPRRYRHMPFIAKPFDPEDITRMVGAG